MCLKRGWREGLSGFGFKVTDKGPLTGDRKFMPGQCGRGKDFDTESAE